MESLFIANRMALADATDLLTHYGQGASEEAAARAEASRINGNVRKFCHWRQIERMVVALGVDTIGGTLH